MTKRMSYVHVRLRGLSSRLALSGLIALLASDVASAQIKGFQIEEAGIADIHNAIRSGQTTCRAVVQSYIERARAYNGVCTALVTADGAPIPASTGITGAVDSTHAPRTGRSLCPS